MKEQAGPAPKFEQPTTFHSVNLGSPPSGFITTQPSATNGMTLQVSNKNVLNKPMGSHGREWSHGLCGCGSACGTCLVAFCCPCIIYGKNYARLGHLNQHNAPHPDPGCVSHMCLAHGAITMCFGVGWILECFNRTETRRRYHIRGNMLKDCCASFWCYPCELTQEHQELELEEQSFRTIR